MIAVAGRVSIKPEMRAQAVSAAIKVTRATQSERGCLQYHFYADLEDPNVLHVFEEWESQETLMAHMQQPHTTEFLAAVGGMAAGAAQVMRYVVSECGPLL